MNIWIEQLQWLVRFVTRTDVPWIMGGMFLAGTVVFILAYSKMGDYLDFPLSGPMLSVTVLALALAVLAAAVIAARLYLAPRYGNWPVFAAPAAGFMAAGLAPLAIGRARYGRGLLALFIAIVAMTAIMAMTRGALLAFAAGDRSVDRVRERREQTGALLND